MTKPDRQAEASPGTLSSHASSHALERGSRPTPSHAKPVVAVIGASGFVGSSLVPELARRAHAVRCVSRDPASLAGVLPANALRMRADLLDPTTLDRVLAGAQVAYYLAHALGEGDAFQKLEERAAENFAAAAARNGVKHIVYLGALAQVDDAVSDHIASRHRVGEILRRSGVAVTEFRASIVIGAGSMPFEVVRALVERLPVMVTPKWVRMPIQPIALVDLLAYLVAALERRVDASRIFEIGGASVVDYARLMKSYAQARGLRRRMIPVPVVTPRLSSLWLKLVTPAHFRMGRRVVASAEHPSVVTDAAASEAFDVRPMGLDAAVERALADEQQLLDQALLHDTDLREGARSELIGSRFIERRVRRVATAPEHAFEAIGRIGGDTGWYWGDWLWRLRGALDRAIGGPGMRRGQVGARPPASGDVLDFWTVVRCDPARGLTLRADMKLPGEALLDLRVRPVEGGSAIVQTACFDARGLPGILYWLVLSPIHRLVFQGMLEGLARACESRQPEKPGMLRVHQSAGSRCRSSRVATR